jgi:hypothetical protein
MPLIMQHAWLLLLGGVLINVPLLWRRARPHIAAHPELEAGYRRLIRGSAFWMSLPWLVMGVGCVIGGVPSFLDYLFPLTGGPFVWAFWAVLYTEFLLLGYWAVWRGGAEALVRHPGFTNVRPHSVRRMKWYMASFAAFAVVWNTAILVWAGQRLG